MNECFQFSTFRTVNPNEFGLPHDETHKSKLRQRHIFLRYKNLGGFIRLLAGTIVFQFDFFDRFPCSEF